MSSRPVLSGAFVVAFAAVLLAFAWVQVFAPAAHGRWPIVVGDDGAGHVIIAKKAPESGLPTVSPGDWVDFTVLTYSQRLRLQIGGPPGTTMTLRVRHGLVWSAVTIEARQIPTRLTLDSLANLAITTLGLLIFAIIGARRPSIGTVALVFLGGESIQTFQVSSAFSWLPDPLYAAIATIIIVMLSEFPIFAVLVFLTRFPRNPEHRTGRLRMRIGDGIVIGAAAICAFFTLAEPVIFATWLLAHNALQIAGVIIVACFAIAAYREATGEDRRRIGWVLVGLVASDVALLGANYVIETVPKAAIANAIDFTAYILSALLPLTLGYAVLRYRVIDLGFVLNRTLVYAVVTALIVVVVSFVDWLSGRIISETRLALAAEAGVTIALGVTLNAVHARIERVVDRLVFRQRYLAERKLRNRLEALSFVTSEAAIDAALTDEIVDILDLRSAAVFRVAEKGAFVRCRSVAWTSDDAQAFDSNSLIVRAIRAADKPFFLADLGVNDPSCPHGSAIPVLAVPIATKNDFVGFALYGGERDGAAPDPEIVAHLAELSAAAATTYALVEARSWRDRFLDLQSSVDLRLPAN